MHRKKIKMVENATRREEKLAIEEISSPLSAQLLEYCYSSELYHQETMPSSQVSSCQSSSSSSSSYRFDENSNPIINPELLYKDADILVNCNNNGDLYALVDDISASIDFATSLPLYVVPPPPLTGTQLDWLNDDFSPPPEHEELQVNDSVVNQLNPMSTRLPTIAEDCVFSPSRATLLAAAGGNVTAFCADILMTGELMQQQQPQVSDYLGESGGFYNSDPEPWMFNPRDIQILGKKESRKLLDGHGSAATAPLPPADISAFKFDDQTFKVEKLSTEEKKEKIHRYLKKRNQRNFSKKIKYACRKTLADSRPRVKGKFAKHHDCGKTRPKRPNSCSHEENEEAEMGMKEEDNSKNSSSDIFGHISAVNSFECSCLIRPWI